MSHPLLSGPCGCVTCANQARSIYATLASGSDTTNMVAWVNSYYDSSIGDIPWGQTYQVTFLTPASTIPDSGGNVTLEGSGGAPQANILCTSGTTADCSSTPVNCTEVGFGDLTVQRTQYYLPLGPDYFVITLGNPITACPEGADYGAGCNCGTAEFFGLVCTFPGTGQPTIIDVPIPDQTGMLTLDPSILVWEYLFGILDPSAPEPADPIKDYPIPIVPNFTYMTSGTTTNNQGIVGFGPNWNPGAPGACDESPADPFTGSDPP